jgi:iron complex transport system ATP-binding protein
VKDQERSLDPKNTPDIGADPPIPSQGGAVLLVREASFQHPEFTLESVNFSLEAGQFAAIVGSNGSGKSTLLKLISGYFLPLKGEVLLDDQPVHAMPLLERARQIAMVLQDSSLSFPLTVQEFVMQGRFPHLAGFKHENSSDLKIVRQALTVTDTVSFARRKVQELSGGERQRVILARALAQQPRLLLLDEPTLNLDWGYQTELVNLLKELSRQEHFTVLMVTHELNVAAEFSDRILLLHRGKMSAWGTPEDVLNEQLLMEVFNLDLLVDRNPISGAPRVTPINHRRRI